MLGLRRFRQVPRSTIVLFAVAVLCLVITYFFVPGSKPKYVHVGKHHSIPEDQTHWNDYLRTGLWVAAALLGGYGFFRWNAVSEPAVDESAAHPQTFGESILDARTQVDPAIGIRPVNSSRDR